MALNEDSRTLSDFRAMPFRPKFSRARSSGGLPVSSDELTRRFLSRFSIVVKSPISAVAEKWGACVGAKFASKSAPINLRAGVLYATADNPQIRQEIQFQERAILKKIKAIDGCASIKSIRFV